MFKHLKIQVIGKLLNNRPDINILLRRNLNLSIATYLTFKLVDNSHHSLESFRILANTKWFMLWENILLELLPEMIFQ